MIAMTTLTVETQLTPECHADAFKVSGLSLQLSVDDVAVAWVLEGSCAGPLSSFRGSLGFGSSGIGLRARGPGFRVPCSGFRGRRRSLDESQKHRRRKKTLNPKPERCDIQKAETSQGQPPGPLESLDPDPNRGFRV